MSEVSEILATREPYFYPVTIETADINCGDERGQGLYVHIFGGALFVPYNILVVSELHNPGSQQSFADISSVVIPQLQERGIAGQGVHSDEHAEHGSDFHTDFALTDPIGCGYANLRAIISQLIVDRPEDVLVAASALQPGRLTNPSDLTAAHDIIAAHGRLASNAARLGTGRAVVRAALDQKTGMMVLPGDHVADTGIANWRLGTSLNSSEALNAGLPTYDHDMWASNELYSRLRDIYPFDSQLFELASLIDVAGTMLALNATKLAARQ